jgi:hypothetical protein
LRNFPGVKLYRKKLVTVENIDDVLFILSEIKKDFHDYLDKKPSLGEIEERNI